MEARRVAEICYEFSAGPPSLNSSSFARSTLLCSAAAIVNIKYLMPVRRDQFAHAVLKIFQSLPGSRNFKFTS